MAADLFDVKSLERAVEGAYGIFLVTLFWEFIPDHGLDGAGEQEMVQFKNLAVAASKSPTLEHLVLSTLPPADKSSGGKFKVPHTDYKDKGVEWIRQNTPNLWAKSSEYWAGFYTSNLWTLPFTKPVKPVSDTFRSSISMYRNGHRLILSAAAWLWSLPTPSPLKAFGNSLPRGRLGNQHWHHC